MKNNEIYRFYINGPAPLVSFVKGDFLHHHFQGKPEAASWRMPRVQVSDKSKRLKDVLMGSFQAPFVSERFKTVMDPVLEKHVEFLPLTKLRNVSYYVMNVIEVVDCLDTDKSDILYADDDPAKILHIARFVFHSQKLKKVPIFKVPQEVGEIFVAASFMEAARTAKLTGIGLDDPLDIRLVKSVSAVPGFPT